MRLTPIAADALDACRRGYPRPQLRRDQWFSLCGEWDFALDPRGEWHAPAEVTWDRRITVPFSPETQASGIADTGFYRAVWYRNVIDLPDRAPGERLMLHFGAVDYSADVWLDGQWVGSHTGAYTPFCFDLTDVVGSRSTVELVVRADDDPHDLAKPRGKQDWRLEPHSIWYPRTTGIWQTVWLEVVPPTRVGRLAFTPNLARWEIGVEAWIEGVHRDPLRLAVTLSSHGAVLAADTYTVIAGEVHRRVALSDPGIDDS